MEYVHDSSKGLQYCNNTTDLDMHVPVRQWNVIGQTKIKEKCEVQDRY